jgi:CubicO group peptidase (beta-lactamase class C family)
MRGWGRVIGALALAVSLVSLLTLAPLAADATAADKKQPPPQTIEELDQRLAKIFADNAVPGASIAVVEDKKLVLAKGYGLADVGKKTPVTPDTLFRAGSISKNMVGGAVMMLVEEGKLDLNAKLADLAPEIEFTNKWEATHPVRLVHLMEHTTGFDDIRIRHYLLEGDVPLKEALDLTGPYVSRWKPGTYQSYSNAAPVIAAYIVEKASGQSWADFTAKRIFQPLGMTSARWTRTPDIAARLAKSYRADGVTPERYVNIMGKPSGALNVTPTDLAKFAQMMIGRGTAGGVTLLKPQSVDRIERAETTLAADLGLPHGYGLGNYATLGEKRVYRGHTGGIDGFASTYIYDPASGTAFVAMINQPNREAMKAVETAIAYLERAAPAPAIAEIKPKPGELEALAGYYQTITPRSQRLALIDALSNWTQVGVREGKLVLDDDEYIAVGPRLFQRTDRAAPGRLFAEVEGEMQMLSATNARRQVPMLELIWKVAFAGTYALVFAFSLLYPPVWITGWLRGRLEDRGGVLVRAIPLLAISSLPALLLLLALIPGESSQAILTFGKPSIHAQAFYWVTRAMPYLGVLSLLAGIFAVRAHWFVRSLAALTGALVLGASLFLLHYGWIGIELWT